MDDLAIVVNWSKRFERLLKEYYHATGADLNALIDSCEERLPHTTYSQLKYIAAIKDNALDTKDFELKNAQQFFDACKDCEQSLQPRSSKMIWRFVLFLIFAVTAGAVWFYAENWSYLISLSHLLLGTSYG